MSLRAHHEAGLVVIIIIIAIAISNHERGVDVGAIGRKAVALGLVSEATFVGLAPNQIQRFILRPACSTAAQVTSVSGHGVGTDKVQPKMKQIGGTIELSP